MMRPGRRVPSRVYASCECSEWFSIQFSSYIFAYIKCSFSCSVAASVNSSPTPRMVATHSRNVPWPRFRKWRSRPRPAPAASRSKCLYSLRAKCILLFLYYSISKNVWFDYVSCYIFFVFFVLFYLFLVPVSPLLCFICSLSIYRFLLQCT